MHLAAGWRFGGAAVCAAPSIVVRAPFPTLCSVTPDASDTAGAAERGSGRSRGRGRGRGRGGGGSGRGGTRGGDAGSGASSRLPRTVRYIPEQEMAEHVREAALSQRFDEAQAEMLGSCGRNIYAMGCVYHPNTITLLQEICRQPAEGGEPWAVLLLRCVAGQMPRLRSAETARVRMDAARAARDRKRRRQ